MTSPAYLSALFVSAIWIVYKLVEFIKKRRQLKGLPVYNAIFSPLDAFGNVFPPSMKHIARGGMYPYITKHKEFADAGWNVIASVTSLPYTQTTVFIADAQVVREVIGNRIKFPKPMEKYQSFRLFGGNILASEGEEWRRHRKISQPAFSEENNRLVWNTSMQLMTELFEEVWENRSDIFVPHALDLTTKIALLVLGVAGFGKEVSWKSPETITEGYEMEFTRTFHLVTAEFATKVLSPEWMLNTTPKLREVQTAFKEMGKYIDEMIEERRKNGQAKRDGRWDLLTNLITASEKNGGDKNAHLSHDELRGDLFVYILAGHETTAHALTFALGLLALHPQQQEKLFEHIQSVVGDRQPTFEDSSRLELILATFYEALRLYPVVKLIPKLTTEDTIFTVSSADPTSLETKQMFVPADSILAINTLALHYNPRYWQNPLEFNPSRFQGEWDRNAFLPFSGGARVCIGRRFSETEAVAVLTSIVSNYTIHLAPAQETEYVNLSTQEKQNRLLHSTAAITLTPTAVPLVFKQRK